jgi:hypothetical protein
VDPHGPSGTVRTHASITAEGTDAHDAGQSAAAVYPQPILP